MGNERFCCRLEAADHEKGLNSNRRYQLWISSEYIKAFKSHPEFAESARGFLESVSCVLLRDFFNSLPGFAAKIGGFVSSEILRAFRVTLRNSFKLHPNFAEQVRFLVFTESPTFYCDDLFTSHPDSSEKVLRDPVKSRPAIR
ncbi:hypothetical protein MUK42_09049 [Musa troglodytarum]|uniref:Uncharacterized protein n=1 Tax=Musa troglodytarum TaxID=320322 RepID=A0A9E7JH92_9LILI|nr:hypothetical protein MUK42_09049 [Musa troglodytarum]